MKTCPFCAEDIQDAAIVCKHCGRELTDRAAASANVAPSSSPIRKARMPLWQKGLLTVATGIVFAVLVSRIDPSSSSTDRTEKLDAEVSFNGLQFTIKNTGTKTWTDCKAEINGIVNGYEARFEDLKPGQSATIRALQFAKHDGERFNPVALKPQEFYVYADVDAQGTRGVWQGGWR